jgi:hypothetical protein
MALNRERILEYAKEYGKEYYQENKEDRLKYKNAYYYLESDVPRTAKLTILSNKDKIADDNSKYYQDNKVKNK